MSQYGQPYARNSAEDGLLLFVIVLLFIGGALFAAWWFFHAQIAAAVMAAQHVLMAGASRFTDRYADLDAQVATTDPAGVHVGALWRLMHNVGGFYRFPAAGLVAVLAVLCLLRNAPGRFTEDLDLSRLMRTQAAMFRSAAPYVRRGLGLAKPAEAAPRPADPALHAGEWVARFATDSDGQYDEHRAVGELTAQLGPTWSGVAGAAPHVRAMLAVFALHAARRRGQATALLGDLAASLPEAKGDGPSGPAAPLAFSPQAVAAADAVLRDPALAGSCIETAAAHAFTAPGLMSALTFARERAGVLAPAQFAFLKLVDRRLWYALHSLGFPGEQNRSEQPNPRIEAIGPRDHWAAERALGEKLAEPSLDRALAVIRAKARAGMTGGAAPGLAP